MNAYIILASILLAYMTLWYGISLLLKRNDFADVAWGFGFILLTWMSFTLSENSGTRGIVVGVLITIWGMRLSLHILARNLKKSEDYRYANWRLSWGKWFYLRSYLQVFLLQGLFLYLIALPAIQINLSPDSSLTFLDIIGIVVWMIGFFFEVVGDAQLARFKKNPENKGKLMQSGLWRYTRHPNYFGEVVAWWGIWLISLSTVPFWLSIIGPLTITILILKVSGVPMLEEKMKEHPEFTDYARRTNMFLPWFPREKIKTAEGR